MGRSRTGHTWNPSKGTYGFLGTHSGSEAGKEARGATKDKVATKIKSSAQEALDMLQKQYDRAYGTAGQKSVYDQQLEFAEQEKELKEEGMITEAETQAEQLRGGVEQGLRQTESQAAQTGFAGSGNVARARQDLAANLSTQSGNIYSTLTDKKDASDLSFDRLKFQTEQEKQSELDRISMEASSIRSQAQQALGGLERTGTAENYSFDPGLESYQQHLDDLGVTGG